MPYEKASFPCCCCVNRVNWNENCFGLCRPPTGNPKVYTMLAMQPKDPWAFVAECNKQFKCTCKRPLLNTSELFGPLPKPMLTMLPPRILSLIADAPGMMEMERPKQVAPGDDDDAE